MKKLPLGEHDFEKLRKNGLLYVDKTRQIYDMINFCDYQFLSRPRRFGKSLLISTLDALFRGRKDLFEGLWIEGKLDWQEYPVFRIDLSKLEYSASEEIFNNEVIAAIQQCSISYGITITGYSVKSWLDNLLKALFENTGKRVVILIDEYDKPVTTHLTDVEMAERNRKFLRKIFETIKADSGYIHYFFMTGISKFSKMSVFSVINQLKDLSLLSQFNDIVGFTEAEVRANFQEHLERFAQKEGTAVEALMDRIRLWYDGYSWDGANRIYNPFGLLNVLADMKFHNYWFESGTPDFLIRLIKKRYAPEREVLPTLQDFENIGATSETFDSYDLENIDLTALLFQTGYLTVLEVIASGGYEKYILTYPNLEVRASINSHIINAFSEVPVANTIKAKAVFLVNALKTADKDQFLTLVRSVFSGIPHQILKKANEYYYQSLFFQLLILLGVENVILEKPGHIGFADGVLFFEGQVFVFEFKFSRKGTMKTLLKNGIKQLEEKAYHLPYLGSAQKAFAISVGFLYKATKEGEKEVLTIDALWKNL